MTEYTLITILLSYYFAAVLWKKYYYKLVTSSYSGVYRYLLSQTVIVGILIISALFITPVFLDCDWAITVFPFLMILINSIFETIFLKKGFKKIFPLLAINFWLYIFYVLLMGIFFQLVADDMLFLYSIFMIIFKELY